MAQILAIINAVRESDPSLADTLGRLMSQAGGVATMRGLLDQAANPVVPVDPEGVPQEIVDWGTGLPVRPAFRAGVDLAGVDPAGGLDQSTRAAMFGALYGQSRPAIQTLQSAEQAATHFIRAYPENDDHDATVIMINLLSLRPNPRYTPDPGEVASRTFVKLVLVVKTVTGYRRSSYTGVSVNTLSLREELSAPRQKPADWINSYHQVSFGPSMPRNAVLFNYHAPRFICHHCGFQRETTPAGIREIEARHAYPFASRCVYRYRCESCDTPNVVNLRFETVTSAFVRVTETEFGR